MTNSQEVNQLLELLKKKEKLTAMLAPSFPIDFSYPEVIGKLKRIGFQFVVEVARGAVDTNKQVIDELKADPGKRVITSPCPSCVYYIKAQHPELVSFLSQADSPMTAIAKLVLKEFPGTKPVFIGPCLTKKLEAKQRPELDILVLTYKELNQIFETLQIKDSTEDLTASFDLINSTTRLYPISGGLCQSAGINELLTEEEYRMVSGIEQLDEALDEFVKDKNIRLLDILFCDGGCINGPGVICRQPIGERRHRVVKFWATHLHLVK